MRIVQLTRLFATGFLWLVALTPTTAQSPSASEEVARLRESVSVLNQVMAGGDTAIPASILRRAEGIAVFPSTVKAGFIFGGMRGRGVLSARTAGGWSPPTFMTLTGGSFGLQVGGQATDLVFVIMNRRGLENFIRNQFKFGADASAAAGPVGRDVQAGTDLQMRAEILSYSRARGLFAGVTVNGSTVRTDVDANYRFYDTRFNSTQIVVDGLAGSPESVQEWQRALVGHAPAR
jgi:lipid-binding SYLF domain-containing protein